MHPSLASSLVAVVAAVVFPQVAVAQCNANNCARAATGTIGGPVSQSARSSACSSFQLCTVTTRGAAIIETVTVSASTPVSLTTVTATQSTVTTVVATSKVVVGPPPFKARHKRLFGDNAKRQAANTPTLVTNCPSSIPTFAQLACRSESAAYASACNCAGISKSFTTVGGSPSTSTSTITVTPSATVSTVTGSTQVIVATSTATQIVVGPASGFLLRVTDLVRLSQYNNLYGALSDDNPNNNDGFTSLVPELFRADVFNFENTPAGSGRRIFVTKQNARFYSRTIRQGGFGLVVDGVDGGSRIVCNITPFSQVVTCVANDGDVLAVCPPRPNVAIRLPYLSLQNVNSIDSSCERTTVVLDVV